VAHQGRGGEGRRRPNPDGSRGPDARERYGNVVSGRQRSAPVARAWIRGERGGKGAQVGGRHLFLKAARWREQRGKRGASVWTRPRGGGRWRRGGGASVAVASVGWLAMALDHQAWAMWRHWRRWLTSGVGVRQGPVAAAGVLGRKRESDEAAVGR
jgi:hypothetical protein